MTNILRLTERIVLRIYRVSKKKRKVFNEPLNNSNMLNFQNLICFSLSTPKLRFSCVDNPFLFTSSRDMKS